ncbi:MAG: NADH-quinone oxidoreductase subunit C [Cyclobacteriaceae bacterium]|jgi:NADH-quinone oxidoreductase subunit C
MTITILQEKLQEQFEGVKSLVDTTPEGFFIPFESIHSVCLFLRDLKDGYFDLLSCVSVVDLGPEQNQFEVFYHLTSITAEIAVTLKVVIGRKQPEIRSVSDIWKTADWHEREAFDLFGVQFLEHPDLRRILLPKDWEGHPMRKDYTEQEKYHGIVVKYDRDDN